MKLGLTKIKVTTFYWLYWPLGSAALAMSIKGAQKEYWIQQTRIHVKALKKLKLIPALAAADAVTAGTVLQQGWEEERSRQKGE